jgi:predicted double-glycine peptidase
LQKLRQINIPVITLMDTRSYKHFVVIRKVDDRFVYIADPSFGNRRIPLEDFEASWNRVIFVVTGTVSGQPEGLYAEAESFNLPKYDALQAGNIWQRAAMDPSMSLLWTRRGGISLVDVIVAPFR